LFALPILKKFITFTRRGSPGHIITASKFLTYSAYLPFNFPDSGSQSDFFGVVGTVPPGALLHLPTQPADGLFEITQDMSVVSPSDDAIFQLHTFGPFVNPPRKVARYRQHEGFSLKQISWRTPASLFPFAAPNRSSDPSGGTPGALFQGFHLPLGFLSENFFFFYCSFLESAPIFRPLRTAYLSDAIL